MSNKPVLDTPLPPNVKAPPTHKPWRALGFRNHWTDGPNVICIEDNWRVTYHNPPHFQPGFDPDLSQCVATWEPIK